MSILAGRCRLYRRFSSAVSYRYPVPRDLLSVSAPRSELMSNADRRPQQLCSTVAFLISLRDLDTAAEYACLAHSKTYCDDTLSTYEIIIRAMCEAKRYRDALDLYHHFFNESSKMSATCLSSNHIIKALCDLGRVDDALAILRTVSPNHINYGHLTKVLVHAGRFEEALSLLRKYPVPLACTNLIRGFLNLGNLDMANQLLEEFESKGFHSWECNSRIGIVRVAFIEHWCNSRIGIVRVAFIEHWFKQGKHEEAMRWYQSLLGNDRYQVFGDTGQALLQLLLSYGKKTEAWDLFHRMLDGFPVHSETIDMMVGECFKEGHFKEGIETFYKVKAKYKYLNLLDHRNVITRCCEQGMLSEAECFFAELSSDRPLAVIDVATHRAMMDAYVKAGRVEDALQTANNMVDSYLTSLALWMHT